MESPVKKLDYGQADKENQPLDFSVAPPSPEATPLEEKSLVAETKKIEPAPKSIVASKIKHDEADEPLLRENPQRFVLFPIKYHEVGLTMRTQTLRC